MSDYQQKMVLFAYRKDRNTLESIGDNIIKSSISKQVEREYASLLTVLEDNYRAIVKMHKYMHVQNISSDEPIGKMENFSSGKFSDVMMAVFERIGCFNQSDYLQTFEIVKEGFKK